MKNVDLKKIIKQIIAESYRSGNPMVEPELYDHKKLKPFELYMKSKGRFELDSASPGDNMVQYAYYIPQGKKSMSVAIDQNTLSGTIGNTHESAKKFKNLAEFKTLITEITLWWTWLYFATKS